MPSFNNTNEMKKQYETDSNLKSRIMIHQLFSTNKFGWSNWVFENYQLFSGQNILELGCGNADIWSSNADKIPVGIRLVLSDFSSGMLDVAKKSTSRIGAMAEYAIIDAQSIPFDENTFDLVIANHMLYHVPDIDKALTEISRVLKPDGIFYATTIGNNNMKEIADILHDYDPAIDFAMNSITSAFGLESGELWLSKHFKSVKLLRYEDSLHITESKPLVDYILSSQGIGNVNEIIVGDKVEQFIRYIDDIISQCGHIDVKKDAGIFISSNHNNV